MKLPPEAAVALGAAGDELAVAIVFGKMDQRVTDNHKILISIVIEIDKQSS